MAQPAIMSSQAFRSACGRAKPELGQAGSALRGYFRQFSTTQSHHLGEAAGAGDFSNDGKPTSTTTATARQRTRAAASEINSLIRNRNGTGQRPQTTATATGDASAAQPKVIDVRSLPRGGLARGRGGGGLRGRGGGMSSTMTRAGAGGSGAGSRAVSPAGGNRFSMANRGRGGAGAAGGARGVRRGRGGRGGGGGRTSGKPKAKEGEKAPGGAAGGPRGKRQDPFERMDAAEQEFDDAMRFGTRTQYSPSLTLEALAPFVPAFASTREGRRAAVMQNLSVLGTADPVGVAQNLQARNYAEELEKTGIRFFADVEAKEAAEQYLQEKKKKQQNSDVEAQDDKAAAAAAAANAATAPAEERIIQDAEESIRKVILDAAVVGKHEEPKFATDPVGIARSWHLRAETYTQRDVESFEKKLASLISAAGGAAARGKPQAKA